MSSPFSFFILAAWGCKGRGKGGRTLWGFHPYSTHLITWSELCLMSSALSGGGPEETHRVAHLYLVLIRSTPMGEANRTVYWAFLLFHVAHTILFVRCKVYCEMTFQLLHSHSEAWQTFLHAEQVDLGETVLGVCWQGRSVHVWGRGQGAELMFPDPASSNRSKQSIVMTGRPQHSLNSAKVAKI